MISQSSPTTLPATPVTHRRRLSWRDCLMCSSENSQPSKLPDFSASRINPRRRISFLIRYVLSAGGSGSNQGFWYSPTSPEHDTTRTEYAPGGGWDLNDVT